MSKKVEKEVFQHFEQPKEAGDENDDDCSTALVDEAVTARLVAKIIYPHRQQIKDGHQEEDGEDEDEFRVGVQVTPGVPLSPPPSDIIELPEVPLSKFQLDESDEDEEKGGGRGFTAVKPWAGSLQPPSNFDPSKVNYKAPDMTLQLDYVYGYRTRGARGNLHWIDEPNIILYHSAAVCVVGDVTTRTQRYFQGHTDDILCLSYNRKKRIAASGGLGKRNTAPLFIWSVDTMEIIQCITGHLEFGVVSCDMSADATRVMGIAQDTCNTVAIFDVATGVLVCTCRGDSNKIVHGIMDTTTSRDSKRNFITIGINHVKFWEKKKASQECVGRKAIGGNIAGNAMCSIACTPDFVVVGNVLGQIYFFSGGVLKKTLAAHTSHCGGLCYEGETLYSGGRDGLVKQWRVDPIDVRGKIKTQEVDALDLNVHSALSHPNRYCKTEKSKVNNQPKALQVVNGKMLVGTNLGGIYVSSNGIDVTTVLESHYDANPGKLGELWGLDTHPTEPLFCTAGDDATLRLWSLDLGTMILMTPITYEARACCFSPDGSTIAVGHANGAFSIWDAMTLTPIVPFTRKRTHRVQDLVYSPNGHFLALSMGTSNAVDLFYAKRGYEFVGFCDGFASNIRRIDWNVGSDVIQCATSSYELVHFNVPTCEINQSPELCDEEWATHTSMIGWGVQGIWEGCNDGTDVNSIGASHLPKRDLCVVGYDSCTLRLYNYPCLPRIIETTGQTHYPAHREFIGHSSHVTQAMFSADDKYVVSTGGMDATVLRWKVVPAVRPLKYDPEDPLGVKRGNKEKTKDDVTADVERGKIVELGESLKNQYPSKLEASFSCREGSNIAPPPDSSLGGGRAGIGSSGGHRGGGVSYGQQQMMDEENQRPASARRRTTARRPGTASAHRQVQSRLLSTTASMSTKTAHGRAQRAHVLQQQQAQKRFSQFSAQ